MADYDVSTLRCGFRWTAGDQRRERCLSFKVETREVELVVETNETVDEVDSVFLCEIINGNTMAMSNATYLALYHSYVSFV